GVVATPARRRRAITSADRFVYVLAVPLALVLLIYVVMPMLATVVTSFGNGGVAYQAFLGSGSTLSALLTSVGISVVSVVTAGVLGSGLAVLLTRFDFPGRRALRVFAILPMALPPLIGAMSFYYLYGSSGIMPRALAALTGISADAVAADGIAGVLLVHTLT